MSEPLPFAKLSGSGNDFLCIDNRDGRHDALLADPARIGHFARTLCRRGLSIGADGIVFACPDESEGLADLAARHFEPDGSEAELCGNGTACFVRWAMDNGWIAGAEARILTTAGVVRGKRLDGDYIRVCIPLPETIERNFELAIAGRHWTCDFAVTGVPHVVTYVPDLEELDLPILGPQFRYHERFAPRGANANFVQVLGAGRLAQRTWEFGVENETLACGTGCAAAAILAISRFGWPDEFRRGDRAVEIATRGGDMLRVYCTIEPDGAVTDLCLETLVRFVCSGSLHPQQQALAMNHNPK